MPRIERHRTSRVSNSSAWLNGHAHNVRSQVGEDGILEKIFEVIGTENRWCVEFGAWDGEYLSNTWHPINNLGWSGVLIEGNSEKFEDLKRTYPEGHAKTHLMNRFVGWEGEEALDTILAETPIPHDFDLLSIDIDGNDYHVWNALNAYRPRVIISEFNPTIPNDIIFVQDPVPDLMQGCSLAALIELGKQKGYELVCAAPWNGIFVRSDLYPQFGIADNSIDAMHHCEWDMTIFHGYDGTFFGAGHMYVNWHAIPLTHEDLHMIPARMRVFPDAPTRVK